MNPRVAQKNNPLSQAHKNLQVAHINRRVAHVFATTSWSQLCSRVTVQTEPIYKREKSLAPYSRVNLCAGIFVWL